MSKTTKNIMIFVGIGVIAVLAYVFLFKKEEEANLTTNTNPLSTVTINTVPENNIDSDLSKDILATLSSVKNITLDDALFSSNAFLSLVDGTVPLDPDGNEGRLNPFAPIGVDSNIPNSIISGEEDEIASPVVETAPTPITPTTEVNKNKKTN